MNQSIIDQRLYIQDVTLRDGSHAVRHRFTLDFIRRVAAALDAAGVASIEVGHGDGLAGSSLNFGPSPAGDLAWIDAAADVVRNARLTTVLLPGIGTIDDLRAARDHGIDGIRLATHCTEADIANQHIAKARELGMDTSGFLMMSGRADPDTLAAQAKIMEIAGAQCVFIADSSGQLTMNAYRDRIRAVRDRLDPATEIGIHAHHNLTLSVANSLVAVEEGVTRVDASLAGLGAGIAVSLALTRYLKSVLFGVTATDVVTYAAVALLLCLVSLVACYIPARRAAKIDPMVALRYE